SGARTANITLQDTGAGGARVALLSGTGLGTGNQVPVLSSVRPLGAVAGANATTLTVRGTNFASGATINFNGVARQTTAVDANTLAATVSAPELATSGSASITVTTPGAQGGVSNPLPFVIARRAPDAAATALRMVDSRDTVRLDSSDSPPAEIQPGCGSRSVANA